MAWRNEPLSKQQIEATLNQIKRVVVEERLNESGGPVDLSALRALVERLTRAADPAIGERITQGDLIQAMDRIRSDLRAQLGHR
jgi:hypothetical protein